MKETCYVCGGRGEIEDYQRGRDILSVVVVCALSSVVWFVFGLWIGMRLHV